MANNYNTNPIYIDTDMTQGWRASQTLNPTANAIGFRVVKVIHTSAVAGHSVTLKDNRANVSRTLTAAFAGSNDHDFPSPLAYEDLQVTFNPAQPAAGADSVLVEYRA